MHYSLFLRKREFISAFARAICEARGTVSCLDYCSPVERAIAAMRCCERRNESALHHDAAHRRVAPHQLQVRTYECEWGDKRGANLTHAVSLENGPFLALSLYNVIQGRE